MILWLGFPCRIYQCELLRSSNEVKHNATKAKRVLILSQTIHIVNDRYTVLDPWSPLSKIPGPYPPTELPAESRKLRLDLHTGEAAIGHLPGRHYDLRFRTGQKGQ